MLVLKLSGTQNLYFYSAYDIVDSYNTFIHIYTHFKFKIDVISFTKGVTIQVFMNLSGVFLGGIKMNLCFIFHTRLN